MVYRPTARVLTVLELLQVHGRMTGAALADRLEVDVRTVRSYIETIQDLGIPVEADRGRYGAYRLRAGYKLPPLIFTEDEALALALSLLLGRSSGLATAAPAVEGAIAKLDRLLPAATRARVRAVQETVVFSNRGVAAPSPGALTVLSSAVQAGRSVQMRYRSPRGPDTDRRFDPYGVVSHWGAWYTIGWCHLRGDERLFRLDRIRSVSPLDDPFSRPADYDVLAAVQRSLANVPRAWQVEVWLDASIDEAVRRSQLPRAYFADAPDGCLLCTTSEDLRSVARFLSGLGLRLVVHTPNELRAAIRRHALTIARDARP